MRNKQMGYTLNRLEFLIGKWNTTGEMITGKKEKIKGMDKYKLVLNGRFLQHRVDVMIGEKGVKVLEMIGIDHPGDNSFSLRSFDSQGQLALMKGNFLRNGNFVITGNPLRAVLTRSKDTKILSAFWEQLGKDNKWEPMMTVRLSK